MEALAHQCGLLQAVRESPAVPATLQDADAQELGRWMDWAARRLGCEAEPIATTLAGFAELISQAAPALLHITSDAGPATGFLVVLKARGRTLRVMGPDLRVHKVAADALTDWLSAPVKAPFHAAIDHLLDVAQVASQQRAKAHAALLQEHLAHKALGACWLLRAAPDAGFWSQVRQARLPRKVVGMLLAFAVLYLAEIVGWGLVGRITLHGHLDTGWLLAWGLLVLSLVPLHGLGGWLDASFALDFGRLLKSRLLAGILRADLDAVRKQGAGQLLSRVMESQALESLALHGGLGVLVAVLELFIAALVLAEGAGGMGHVALLGGWLLVSLGLSYRYFKRLRHWTLLRLDMTHSLVEQMVGHRTRLAQEQPGRRDVQEDTAMRDYLDASRAMDRSIVPAAALMPRGWMLVGLLGLVPAFVAGGASSAALAIALGGMLLANRALVGISAGLAALSRAQVAWVQVADLFIAPVHATRTEPFFSAAQLHNDAQGASQPRVQTPLVEASQLTFAYAGASEPVLKGLNLAIGKGERILLEGPSGAGKSTIASMLVGLRRPQSGLLLLNGLDRHTLGDSWHQLTTEAPQFHENHILSGPLAFNVLMGRDWPASSEALDQAQAVCEELGLGDLLQRMPSGIMQMVGETGWQLSHGERSRIFLARALLQEAPLTVLDESFAALDPQTLQLCLECALRRTSALVVIAHP